MEMQADAKEVNTHQAALFASSSQGHALLAAPVRTTQRDIPRRSEQKDQHVEYEQQDGQAAPQSDKRVHYHCKQDAKRTTPSSSMEIIQSSFALWTMTLWMANSPTQLAEPQASHMNGW